MKVNIYIHRDDAAMGKLDPKTYCINQPPQYTEGKSDYVMVTITPDEFCELEDMRGDATVQGDMLDSEKLQNI
tara:strand:- start:708 stop:926 length:219 start_codon:yes stop_codon:yes gene_type:complete